LLPNLISDRKWCIHYSSPVMIQSRKPSVFFKVGQQGSAYIEMHLLHSAYQLMWCTRCTLC
jgi:hypothetical protein